MKAIIKWGDAACGTGLIWPMVYGNDLGSGNSADYQKPVQKQETATMGDTWYTNLNVFLDENGEIAVSSGPARKLAEHITAIVAMASRPELIPLPEYQVRCRRRPGRKPCTGIIEANFDPEDCRIMWWCPVCDDCGYISNWQDSMWDLRNADEVH